MNASPLIRLYLEILSNEILKKGTCPNGQIPSLIVRELTYSSTAACAAARRAMGTRNGEQET